MSQLQNSGGGYAKTGGDGSISVDDIKKVLKILAVAGTGIFLGYRWLHKKNPVAANVTAAVLVLAVVGLVVWLVAR